MFGTSPPVVEDNIMNYCVYYSSTVEIMFDPKTSHGIHAKLTYSLDKLLKFIVSSVALGIMISVLEAHSYKIFREGDSEKLGMMKFFHWGHLLNNFSLACKLRNGLMNVLDK